MTHSDEAYYGLVAEAEAAASGQLWRYPKPRKPSQWRYWQCRWRYRVCPWPLPRHWPHRDAAWLTRPVGLAADGIRGRSRQVASVF